MNILKIGIASREEMKARTMAIARGEMEVGGDDPKVWFTSIESLAQVLSTKNKMLLEIIKKAKPTSLAELAKLSEREESNLSRTLHTMERYGFVVLRKTEKGKLVVIAPYDAYEVKYGFANAAMYSATIQFSKVSSITSIAAMHHNQAGADALLYQARRSYEQNACNEFSFGIAQHQMEPAIFDRTEQRSGASRAVPHLKQSYPEARYENHIH